MTRSPPSPRASSERIRLEVEDLALDLPRTGGEGWFRALDGITFSLAGGRVTGLLGTSAAGKSLLGLALLGLTPPGGRLSARRFRLDGAPTPVEGRGAAGWQGRRGQEIAWIPQEPARSLDPTRTVGAQVRAVLRAHGRTGGPDRVEAALSEVGLDAAHVAGLYPHALSGGMAQRVALGLALILDPGVIVADEPTAALDLEAKVRVLDVLRARATRGAAILLVSHDLPVVRAAADRLVIVDGGRVVETGPASDVFADPRQPITAVLLGLTLGVEGQAPDLEDARAGCPSRLRCPFAVPRCEIEAPRLEAAGARRWSCHFPLPRTPQGAR